MQALSRADWEHLGTIWVQIWYIVGDKIKQRNGFHNEKTLHEGWWVSHEWKWNSHTEPWDDWLNIENLSHAIHILQLADIGILSQMKFPRQDKLKEWHISHIREFQITSEKSVSLLRRVWALTTTSQTVRNAFKRLWIFPLGINRIDFSKLDTSEVALTTSQPNPALQIGGSEACRFNLLVHLNLVHLMCLSPRITSNGCLVLPYPLGPLKHPLWQSQHILGPNKIQWANKGMSQ